MKILTNNLEPWNPLKNVVWYGLDTSISKSEIKLAIKNKTFLCEPINYSSFLDMLDISRAQHINRIAYLVQNQWNDPIGIDVGVPSLGCHVDWIVIDGNHRLAAAFYRRDEFIDVSISGDIDYAARLLNSPEIAEYYGDQYNASSYSKINSLLDKKTLSKNDRESIRQTLKLISTEIRHNLPFYLDQFNEAVERITTTAKTEVDGFMTAVLRAAGMERLAEGSFSGFLPGKKKEK